MSVLDLATLRVTVLAGDGDLTSGVLEGVGTSAKLPFVSGLASDPVSGALYASLNIDATVVRILPNNGSVSIFSGVSRVADGLGLNARFGHLSAMVVDAADNLIVADSVAHTVRRVATATGAVTTIAGASLVAGFADGAATAARFNRPSGIALNGSSALYVADALNHAIRLLDLAAGTVRTVAGGRGAAIADGPALTAAQLNYPAQLAVSGGAVFFIDCVNFGMKFYSPPTRAGDRLRVLRGGVVTTLGEGAGGVFFNFGGAASSLAVEPSSGNVFMTNFWAQEVVKWSPAGGALGSFSYVVGTSPGWPTGLAFDAAGRTFGTPGAMLVSRWSSWAVLRYNMPPAVASIAGAGNAFGAVNPGSQDGIFGNTSAMDGAVALQPGSIAFDSKGDVFIAHAQHNKIVRVGRLAGAACSFAVPAHSTAHACRPGTRVDWAARTCQPCPPAASVDVFPFSSYCQDASGTVIPQDAAAAAAVVAGISVGGVAAGIVVVVGLLAARAYYVVNARPELAGRKQRAARRASAGKGGGGGGPGGVLRSARSQELEVRSLHAV